MPRRRKGSLADSAVQPNDSPTFAGLNTTGDVSFGDNDKAIFGAGSDLQIYHDGSNSYVHDAGVGSLILRATNFRLFNAGETKVSILANDGGETSLYHDGSKKIATTSTGIDVTGTVTADGLTVERENLSDLKVWSNSDVGSIDFYQAASYPAANNYGRVLDINSGSSNSVGGSTIRMLTAEGNGAGKQRLNITNNGDISFYEDTGTTPKFFWDASAESLGIGTDSPSDLLNLSSSDPRIRLTNTGSGYCLVRTGGSDASLILDADAGNTGAGSDIIMRIDGSEKMRIDASGNVGIGTSSPSSFYGDSYLVVGDGTGTPTSTIYGSSTGTSYLLFADGTSGSDAYRGAVEYNHAGDHLGFFSSGSEKARIDSSGNLLVGTTSGSDKVTVNGTVSATNFNTTSDATLKTNVETLTGSLDAVNALRGVSFDWIENGGSEVGFIAQEVEEVLPEVVSTNDQGIKSVKYGNMVAVLVEALKEQQAQIDELKAKLEG